MLKNKEGLRELRKPLVIMSLLLVVLFVLEVVYMYYAQMQGHFSRGIYLLGGLLGIWLLIIVGYIAMGVGYRRGAKDMEPRKSTLMMQEIVEEKQKLEEIVDRIVQEQHIVQNQGMAMDRVAGETIGPVRKLLELNEKIHQEARGGHLAKYTGEIKTIAGRLLLTMDNILDISRLEKGQLALQSEEYSLKALLEEIYVSHSSREEMQQLLFSCQASADLPSRLVGDKKRIRQILDTLLVNSARHTKKGSIRLSVFGKVYEDKVHLLFSVKDTGIGMEEAKLRRLNQAFGKGAVRGSQPLNDVEIGLHLSNGILHLMDSQLHGVSIHGQGSEFYFELEQDVAYGAPVGRIDFSNECAPQGM